MSDYRDYAAALSRYSPPLTVEQTYEIGRKVEAWVEEALEEGSQKASPPRRDGADTDAPETGEG